MKDPFSILGLTREASEDEINKAFKKLAKTCHPDLHPNDKEAEAKFKEYTNARDSAIDIKQGKNRSNSGPNFEDIFNSTGFGFGFGGGGFTAEDIFRNFTMHHQQRNHDLDVTCQITLEDAFNGRDYSMKLQFNSGVREVKAKIPAGVDTGNRIRVPQAGDDRIASLKPGDLYVNIRVMPHARFHRQGLNLLHVIDIELFDLLCGKTVEIDGIDGKKLEAVIPPSFNPDNKLRLMGQGMPVVNGNGRGDLFIGLNVIYPILNNAQLDMIRRIKDLK